MKTYYAVMQRGLPVGLYSHEWKATEVAREVTVPGAKGEVVVVTPVQMDFDFSDEEPTKPDEPCLNDNYEVGSGRRCYCSRGPEGH